MKLLFYRQENYTLGSFKCSCFEVTNPLSDIIFIEERFFLRDKISNHPLRYIQAVRFPLPMDNFLGGGE